MDLGIEVCYIEQPADFDHHFVNRGGDAGGPFKRLFERLPLNNSEAAGHFFRFGKRSVGDFRLYTFEADTCAHRRRRGQTVEREQHTGFL